MPGGVERVQRKQTLSVIVISKNEEDRIGGCLGSVAGWAEEIVVLDSGSTDRTVEIARRYTDRVYETDWPGFGLQKQRALEKASGDWVLSLDADEQMTPQLQKEIDELLSATPKAIAYRVPYEVHVYGKRLNFGPNGTHLRLFRRDRARFSDARVHEHVVVAGGPVGKLRSPLLHFTHRDFKHALDKHSQCAWLWAHQRHERGQRAGMLAALGHAAWSFFTGYVIRLGFLDGRRGLLMAALCAQYTFNKYVALWTLGQQGKRS